MEVVKLKPFILHPFLSDDQIETYNASNSIITSEYLFQEMIERNTSNNVGIIGLYYKTKKIYVDIIDSHQEDSNIMYVSQWIYDHFDYQENDLVNYMQVYPKHGNRIKIKPRGDFYAYLDDPVSALRNGFEKYSCLIENTVILININNIPLEVEILETYINSELNKKNQPIYIRGVELEVDITSDTTETNTSPESEVSTSPVPEVDDNDWSMLPTPQVTKFTGKGYSLK